MNLTRDLIFDSLYRRDGWDHHLAQETKRSRVILLLWYLDIHIDAYVLHCIRDFLCEFLFLDPLAFFQYLCFFYFTEKGDY